MARSPGSPPAAKEYDKDSPEAKANRTAKEYKDTWTDSRGRTYTRRNMDVRTREGR